MIITSRLALLLGLVALATAEYSSGSYEEEREPRRLGPRKGARGPTPPEERLDEGPSFTLTKSSEIEGPFSFSTFSLESGPPPGERQPSRPLQPAQGHQAHRVPLFRIPVTLQTEPRGLPLAVLPAAAPGHYYHGERPVKEVPLITRIPVQVLPAHAYPYLAHSPGDPNRQLFQVPASYPHLRQYYKSYQPLR